MGICLSARIKAESPCHTGTSSRNAEVNYLGQFSHPNLVNLIGYCLEDEHRLLVYEFMPCGSLENHLFRRGSYFQPLSWSLRLKVALGAAKGLAFLHSAETKVIYRDFKTSNVLLDSVCKIILNKTSHLTTKSDVYSFGVVLLEMLTGRRAVDKNRPKGEQSLVEWAKPYLPHKRKLFRVLDNRLEGQYTLDGAHTTANLALRCVSMDPRFRPRMAEVVKELELLQDPKGITQKRRHSNNEAQTRRLVSQKSVANSGCCSTAYPRPSASAIHSN
ncbi:hypothetical protein M8C21_019302 [Ambrosia artemisiifolia]|uniref:Protein kinase domain-containing protein n=1 Tax=Ambrosia artemisiifolia TaxID=4212 RepID=A0AAD5GPD1_AMBAR|nr:hypothetical protein M8C21_019302 [Ambrosia artemisiifolia]